jgi:hypothetical protein
MLNTLNSCVLENMQRNVWYLTWLIHNGEVWSVWIFKLRIKERVAIKSIYWDLHVRCLVNLTSARIGLVKPTVYMKLKSNSLCSPKHEVSVVTLQRFLIGE